MIIRVQDYGLWESFNAGLLPLTTDAGLSGSIESATRHDLSDLGPEVTPTKWISVTCALHNYHNILVECLKILPNELQKNRLGSFANEIDRIQSTIDKADHRKKRKNEDCAKCLNDILQETEPTDAEKNWIASLRYKNYDSKSEEDKRELQEKITAYWPIKPIFKVRFRSWCEALQTLMEAKNVIKGCILPTNPNSELFPDGDLPWDLITALHTSFNRVKFEINVTEQKTAGLSGYIQSMLDLIESTLDQKDASNET